MAVRSHPLKDHWKELRLFRSRVIGAAVVVSLLTGVLIWRLVDLQVIRHQSFSELSQDNQIKIEPLPPTRGVIYDRNRRILATNEPTWQLTAVREDIDDLEAALAELEALDVLEPANRPALIESVRAQPGWQPVLLANLNEVQAATFAVHGHRFRGIDIQAGLIRFYPDGEAAAHAVGYVGRPSTSDYERMEDRADYSGTLQIGKTGIERAYEDRLHGSVGARALVVDAHRRPTEERVPGGLFETRLPAPGEHVILSLDIELQRAAAEALAGFRGSVVALDPRSGDVLALVSMPAFDPNTFATGMSAAEYAVLSTDPNLPFLNRALRQQYSPGSTVKPFLALAGLHYEMGYVAEEHFCGGEYHLEGSSRVYGEPRNVLPHGEMTLHSAIVRSCNVYFFGLGVELGIDRMEAFLRSFGFGSRIGIDIDSEYAGIMPGRDWKRASFRNREDQSWYRGETVITAIGQGYIEVTPLQLAHATATLAASGARYRPRLLVATENAETGALTAIPPEPLEGLADVDPAHWQLVQQAMLGVTTEPRGTGFRTLGDAAYPVAGKTGTAQVIARADDPPDPEAEETIEERYRDNGLFIGYAPAENPEIALAVIVENQGGGGSTAAPIARKVLDAYFGHTEYVAQLVAF